MAKKYYNFFSNLLIGSLMTLVMTFCLTLLNQGYPPDFWWLFWKSYGIALLVAIPTTFTVVPLVQNFLDWVYRERG